MNNDEGSRQRIDSAKPAGASLERRGEADMTCRNSKAIATARRIGGREGMDGRGSVGSSSSVFLCAISVDVPLTSARLGVAAGVGWGSHFTFLPTRDLGAPEKTAAPRSNPQLALSVSAHATVFHSFHFFVAHLPADHPTHRTDWHAAKTSCLGPKLSSRRQVHGSKWATRVRIQQLALAVCIGIGIRPQHQALERAAA
jgi:hypothetical protein